MRSSFLVFSYLTSLCRQHAFSKVIQVNIFKSIHCVVNTKLRAYLSQLASLLHKKTVKNYCCFLLTLLILTKLLQFCSCCIDIFIRGKN